MRVYELARILGVASKDLIADLKRIRVTVKSASSSIEDKYVRKVMERFEKRKVQDAARKEKEKKEAAQRRREEAARKKREEAERKRREEEERKQREEEERKQREEEARTRREEAARRKKEEEEKRRKQNEKEEEAKKKRAETARKVAKPSADQITEVAAAEAPPEKPPARRGKKRARAKKDEPVEVIELPKIEVMKLDDPRKLYAERARRRAKERKKERKTKGGKAAGAPDGELGLEETPPRKPGRRIRPSFVVKPTPKREAPRPTVPVSPKPVEPRVVKLRGEVTVAQFAEKAGLEASEVIAKLLSLGEARTINQMLEEDWCELLGEEFEIKVEIIPETDEYDLREYEIEDKEENMTRRPPVVTVMGHVDHGKTTLLDYIREARVVEGEFGGITQHIGAYRVPTPRGEIVFLDTPGHEAFTSMRARGASVTDIVVLVVAADDGVMPQTLEAIDHARAGSVPIIVAINKIDKPEANPERVRQELIQREIVPENLGGDTIFAHVSAKTGDGVDHLLEMVALQAEVMELKADPQRRAEGVVVEAHMDAARGSAATLLVQKGTLEVGDALVIGRHHGRVRAMLDEYGHTVDLAGPAYPVTVLGLGGSPEAGERFLVMPNERAARNVAAIRDDRRRQRLLGSLAPPRVTLENLHDLVEEGRIQEFRLILKADVQGSLEAISQALARLPSEKIKLRTIRAAVGPISALDVNLAKASEAIVIGFNVRPDPSAHALAEREGVQLNLYQVIYELIEDVLKAMTAALAPETREIAMGRVEVRQTFRISKVGVVAGCFVSEGEVRRGAQVRLVRDGVVVYDGTIASLRREKNDVERVLNGLECGIALRDFQDIKEDDILEVYETEEVPVEL